MCQKIGEVVESATGDFIAQSYTLHWAPPLGSLVKTCAPPETSCASDSFIYGVVCYSTTGSLEPGRRPTARGRDLEDEGDVYTQNPQLGRLLSTSFKSLVVGHVEAGRLCHYLPPRPAKVHAFVYPCSETEVVAFTQTLDFLDLLLGATLTIPSEELVAACLRTAAAAWDDGRAFLVRAGKELAMLLAGDPARLNAILRKIRP